jgi:hypothetical protein
VCAPLFLYAKGRKEEEKDNKAPRLLFIDPLPERKRKFPTFGPLLFHNLVPKCDANADNALKLVRS